MESQKNSCKAQAVRSIDTDLFLFRGLCDASKKLRKSILSRVVAEWLRLHWCYQRSHLLFAKMCIESLLQWFAIMRSHKDMRKREFLATYKYFCTYWRQIFAVLLESRDRGKQLHDKEAVSVRDYGIQKRIWDKWIRDVRPQLLEEKCAFEIKFVLIRSLRTWRCNCDKSRRVSRSGRDIEMQMRIRHLLNGWNIWNRQMEFELSVKARLLSVIERTDRRCRKAILSSWCGAVVKCHEQNGHEKYHTVRLQFKRFVKLCRKESFLQRVFSEIVKVKFFHLWRSAVDISKKIRAFEMRVGLGTLHSFFSQWKDSFDTETRLVNIESRRRLEILEKAYLGWTSFVSRAIKFNLFRVIVEEKIKRDSVREMMIIVAKTKKVRAASLLVVQLALLQRKICFLTGGIAREVRISFVAWRTKTQNMVKVKEILTKVEQIKVNLTLLSH